MPSINLPTYMQVEAVKEIVDNIASNFPIVTNMQDYEPLYRRNTFRNINSLTEIVSITGDGFISGLSIAVRSTLSSPLARILVQVDEVNIIDWNYTYTSDSGSSISLTLDDTIALASAGSDSFIGFPYNKTDSGNGNGTTITLPLANPIFFKSSFKVFIVSSWAADNQMRIKGGIK